MIEGKPDARKKKFAARSGITRGSHIQRADKASREPHEKGKFVVIDIYSGDYEIDERDADTSVRLMSRHPDALTWAVRIGYPTPYAWTRLQLCPPIRCRMKRNETVPSRTLESTMQELGLELVNPSLGAARICSSDIDTMERIYNVILRSELYSYRKTLSNPALLTAHSLPMRHAEAQNIAKTIISILKGSIDRWWSTNSIWHSTNVGSTPRVYSEDHSKWIYSSDCPRPHAESTLMHCLQHNTWDRSRCSWMCEQGLMQYTLTFDKAAFSSSRKIPIPTKVGEQSNNWLYEVVSGEKLL